QRGRARRKHHYRNANLSGAWLYALGTPLVMVLVWVIMYMSASLSWFGYVCVCVCACMRQRAREIQRDGKRDAHTCTHMRTEQSDTPFVTDLIFRTLISSAHKPSVIRPFHA